MNYESQNYDKIKKAKIYRKETNCPLTSYQKTMNDAAQELSAKSYLVTTKANHIDYSP